MNLPSAQPRFSHYPSPFYTAQKEIFNKLSPHLDQALGRLTAGSFGNGPVSTDTFVAASIVNAMATLTAKYDAKS